VAHMQPPFSIRTLIEHETCGARAHDPIRLPAQRRRRKFTRRFRRSESR
jgi:hypothetical protein